MPGRAEVARNEEDRKEDGWKLSKQFIRHRSREEYGQE
jgi:hypothetical protein